MSKWFRLVGRLEGSSFLLLLLFAMPLKYYGHIPLAVQIIGPLHGALFLAYCALAFWIATNEEWPLKQQLLAYAAAILPFGTFLFEKKFVRVTSLD